jgi:uncharacterized membrane protein YdjX (TVP38/TMEM64 family)
LRFYFKFLLTFGAAYSFLWILSLIMLIPYYSSPNFDTSAYINLPFMTKIISELSEHYLTLQFFLTALTYLFPLTSILMILSAWVYGEISAVPRMKIISQPLYFLGIFLALVSFVPMVWIIRELLLLGGPSVYNWFSSAIPVFSSYVQAGQEFVSLLLNTTRAWMATYGPVGLVASMIVSSVISPIPNEAILAFAGMTMNPFNVAFFGALGSTIGGIICFYIARLGGKPLVGKFIKKETLTSVNEWFQKRGSWAILLGRLIPFIPFDAVSYFSGLTNIRVSKFSFLTFIASVPRCLLYAYVGALIADYNLPVLAALSISILIIFLIFRFKNKLKLAR